MPKTVTARFETEPEAERALAAVAAEVPLRDSAIVSSGLAGSLTLESLNLPPEERAACEQQLSKGGFLVVAQVASESRSETVLRLLHNLPPTSEPEAPPEPQASPEPQAPPEPQGEPELPAEAVAEGEERIPLVEEELRIGKREVVRGRARVRSFVTETPVHEQVELFHEEAHLERRPVNRRLSDEEVLQGGLLQERVIEITEMREEAVVTKEAFVREELVISKSIHRRVERIEETVRRTEVETERLHPEGSAAAGGR
jgi:uncharacterized protein (TIGR02271 family)